MKLNIFTIAIIFIFGVFLFSLAMSVETVAEEQLHNELKEGLREGHLKTCMPTVEAQYKRLGFDVSAETIMRYCTCVGNHYFSDFTRREFDEMKSTGSLPRRIEKNRAQIQDGCAVNILGEKNLTKSTNPIGELINFSELVERNGLYYKKFTDFPYSGLVQGKRRGNLKNGKFDGPWLWFHDNGQLFVKDNWKNGKRDGPSVSYYNNGQLSGKGTYKDGKKDGPSVWYHDNGQLWAKGTYKNGKAEGPWVRYHEDGTVY